MGARPGAPEQPECGWCDDPRQATHQKKNLADADTVRPYMVRPIRTPAAGMAPSDTPVIARSFNRLLAFTVNSSRCIGRNWANAPTVVKAGRRSRLTSCAKLPVCPITLN